MTSKVLSCQYLYLCLLSSLLAACSPSREATNEKSDYTVAAYVWPSCHNDSIAQKVLWAEGIGEWEMIKKGTPRFKGHYQPRVPLWGYRMDDDPAAMEQKINAASDHGVNTFIFDWYWFGGGPFLEGSVNAFVKAPNTNKMNFYLMWANHDVPGNMWNHYRYKTDSLLWKGTVDWDNFRKVTNRVINQYFKQPNYYKIDGKPVFSIYSVANFIKSFGDLNGAQKAMNYFREEVTKAGFPGLHIQLVGREEKTVPIFPEVSQPITKIVETLGINSVTLYNMAALSSRSEDYLDYGRIGLTVRQNWDSLLTTIPFVPCVSVGWDDTPRYPKKGMDAVVHLNTTPSSFGALLQKAKDYLDERPKQPKLLIINAWNEWVEGSYLEPDTQWGYDYLETVKKVMGGTYDPYSPAAKAKPQ